MSEWKERRTCPQCLEPLFKKRTKEGKWQCLKKKCGYWLIDKQSPNHHYTNKGEKND